MYEVGAPQAAQDPAARNNATAPLGLSPGGEHQSLIPPSPLSELWRRKLLILLVALLTAAAAVGIGSLFAPRYNALTQLVIDPSELRIVDRGLRNSSQLNEAMIAEVETQTRVLLSNKVLRRVVQDQNLINDTEFVSDKPVTPLDHLRQLLKRAGLRSDEDTGSPDLELTALRTLEERVWAQRQERTFVVNLGVWTSDRQKSVRIVNAIVDAFLDEQQSSTSTAARQATASLASRLDGLKQRVIEAEQSAEQFKRANNILSASGQLVNEQQLTAVSGQLIQARTRRAQAEARERQIQQIRRTGGDIGSIPEATGSQTLAALRGQLAAAGRREAELSAQLLPRHPAVGQARQEVRRLTREVNAETGRIASSVSRDVQRARDSEQALSKTLDTIKSQLTGINAKQVQLRELERDVQANRSVYEAFLLRTQEIAQQEKLVVPKTRVISPATPPKNKTLPPSKAVLAIGGFGLGTGLGCALALALLFAGFGSRRHQQQARATAPVTPTNQTSVTTNQQQTEAHVSGDNSEVRIQRTEDQNANASSHQQNLLKTYRPPEPHDLTANDHDKPQRKPREPRIKQPSATSRTTTNELSEDPLPPPSQPAWL
ncbi:MAG: GumC family protein [Pseudomonadota bacterium]